MFEKAAVIICSGGLFQVIRVLRTYGLRAVMLKDTVIYYVYGQNQNNGHVR